MKLIGLMSLETYKEDVRKIFQKHDVQIFSEVSVTGYTAETVDMFSWWHLEKDMPIYSTLYFAIIPKDKADEIMKAVQTFSKRADPQHPSRAFQVNVEKMV